MAAIPDKYRDLLDTKALAYVATTLADGSPQVTPVWFDHQGDTLRINTAKGRVKARTMNEGAKVALAIVDPANAYRYMQVRGTVTRTTGEGADAHIDSLAKKYLGKDKYPFRQPGEERITLEITPEAVHTMG